MKRLLLLVLLCGSSAIGAHSVADRRPSKMDAAMAYFEWETELCRKMIDVCEAGPLPPSPDRIGKLDCRPAGAGRATCRFETGSYRCEARFVSASASRDYARAKSRARSGTRSGRTWLLDWRSSPRPRGPRISCDVRH